MPFIFSESDNVEEAKIQDKLKERRKRPAVTTIFFRERWGFLGGTGNALDTMYSWKQRVWRGLEFWFSYWTILKRFKISPKWKHFAEEGVAFRQNNTWIKCRINSLSKGHRIWSTVIIWSERLKALHASFLQTSCEMQEIQVAVVWRFPICS